MVIIGAPIGGLEREVRQRSRTSPKGLTRITRFIRPLAPWPSPDLTAEGDPEVLDVVSSALAQVRRAKSARSQSMRAEVALATVRAPAPALARLARAEADLRAAGRIAKLDLVEVPSGGLTVTCDL